MGTGVLLRPPGHGYGDTRSDGWTRRNGVVMLIADDDPVRLEFVRRR
ncbi:hypothetical protein [Actinoallomurus rhizosphaericola]|nr:hypothetical protein [Actinoallomurus rhizosphaericola]MCO5994223.1 hypothetical protein [Actinoallomurus rhizosphaericola]